MATVRDKIKREGCKRRPNLIWKIRPPALAADKDYFGMAVKGFRFGLGGTTRQKIS